jgi:predicted nucleotide-binding protein (sugar kinase/HSP70/actin superfamily)
MDESPEERAQRVYLSEIMRQLTESERFKRFFKVNYEVQTHVSEEDGEFRVVLIERPPELAQQILSEMLVNHAKENMPAVTTASLADLSKIDKAFKKS